jgi:hypothetical protein
MADTLFITSAAEHQTKKSKHNLSVRQKLAKELKKNVWKHSPETAVSTNKTELKKVAGRPITKLKEEFKQA